MCEKLLGQNFLQFVCQNILHVHARRHPQKRLYVKNENNPHSFLNEKNNTFKKFLLPDEARGTTFDYDVWFNTNENVTIRKWLYTDFLGKGIYLRVNSRPINTKLFKSIVNSDIEIDEERIEKIRDNLHDKYALQWNTEFYDKVVFLPGSNLLCKGTVIDYRKVKALVDKGWKIKPHPITAHVYMADLRRRFGAENVLNKKEGGYELLLNCKQMAFSQNS